MLRKFISSKILENLEFQPTPGQVAMIDELGVFLASEDHSEFAAGLARITAGGDEYTLPAIDWAADMTWRTALSRTIA